MVLEYSANYTIIGIECQAFLKYLDRPLDAPSHGVVFFRLQAFLDCCMKASLKTQSKTGSLGQLPNPPFRETHEERNRCVRLVDPVLPPLARRTLDQCFDHQTSGRGRMQEPLHVEGLAQVDQEIEAAINLLKQNRGAYSSIVILAVPASCLPREPFLEILLQRLP